MKYTEDHEWLRVDGDVVVVGITAHASEQLGDVVFVELPDTPMKAGFTGRGVSAEQAKAAEDRYTAGVPMGRLVRADEVAKAVLWLASDDASFVTGIELPVDGGFTAK